MDKQWSAALEAYQFNILSNLEELNAILQDDRAQIGKALKTTPPSKRTAAFKARVQKVLIRARILEELGAELAKCPNLAILAEVQRQVDKAKAEGRPATIVHFAIDLEAGFVCPLHPVDFED